jgi:WbqC-like protein family
MKTVAIHQPEYFPWLGFLDKAMRADVFVLLDHVQFDRSSLQHRAKVLGPNGAFWLTIPFVHKFPQTIDELRFVDDRWPTKHQKSLQQAYGRSAGWKEAAPKIEAFFAKKYDRVVDATIASVALLFEAFGITKPEIVRSSSLGVVSEKAELVHDVCKRVGATRYLSGRTGASYLDGGELASSGIELVVQSFALPEYPRRAVPPEEARGLSALDAWLVLGDKARSLLEPPGGSLS